MKASLKIPQASQQDKDGLQYVYDNRELLSKTKQYLVIRKKIKLGNFKYSCNKCDLQARKTDKSYLKIHQQLKHDGIATLIYFNDQLLCY